MLEKIYTESEVMDIKLNEYLRGRHHGYDVGYAEGRHDSDTSFNEGYSSGFDDGYEEGSTKACTLLDPRPVTEHNTESTITITIST